MLMQTNKAWKVLTNRIVLVELIQKLLTDILSDTDSLQRGNSAFHCKDQIPSITIGDYLKRISKFANCSNSIFVMSLIYIDKLQQNIDGFVLNHYCVHRLLISTIMVAAKFSEDFFYKNEFYAKIGGISKAQINLLEIEIVKKLNYRLFVPESELLIYLQKLQAYQDVNQKI